MLLTIPTPFPRLDLDQLRRHARAATKPKPDRRGETEAEILADLFRIHQRGQHTTSAADSTLLASAIAIPFNVVSRPHQYRGRPIRIEPGAFDGSLAAIASGRLHVPLLVDHFADRVLGATCGGGVVLVQVPGGVALGITNSPAGRSIIAWMKANPSFGSLSGGYDPLRIRESFDDRGRPVYAIESATLREVSVVKNPAFDGTAIRILR